MSQGWFEWSVIYVQYVSILLIIFYHCVSATIVVVSRCNIIARKCFQIANPFLDRFKWIMNCGKIAHTIV